MMVQCPCDDSPGCRFSACVHSTDRLQYYDLARLCGDGRPSRELSTGLEFSLDSFGGVKSNQVTQQTYRRVPARPSAHAPLQGRCACADSQLAIRLILYRVTEGSAPLADIFVQCPRTGAPISTGLKSEWVLLKSLPCVPIPVRCPACGQMHKWMPQDAWMGPALPSPAPRQFGGSRAAS